MARYDVAMADALIAQMEGCVLHPYRDSKNIWTIGVGCTTTADGQPVTAETPPLKDQQAAFDLMSIKLHATVEDVRAMVKRRDVADFSYGALYSFAFNEGAHRLLTSHLMALFNADAPLEIVAQKFADFAFITDPQTHRMIKLGGLVRRRAVEAACFTGRALPINPAAMPAPAPPPAPQTADDLNAAELTKIGD